MSPDRRQAIIWTNAGILLIWTLGTNFSEILIAILTFAFKKTCLKVSTAKRRPFCLGLNVLSCWRNRIYNHPIIQLEAITWAAWCRFWTLVLVITARTAFLFKKWKITLGYALTKTSAKSRYRYANEIVEDYEITFNLTDEFMKWILAKISYIGNSIWSS